MFPEIITTVDYISVSIATVSISERDRLSSFDVELQLPRILFMKISLFCWMDSRIQVQIVMMIFDFGKYNALQRAEETVQSVDFPATFVSNG